MGAVHVPVNFPLKGEELRHILRDADVALIAADPALLGLAEEAAADLARERGAEAPAVWPLLPAIRLIAKPNTPPCSSWWSASTSRHCFWPPPCGSP